MAERNIELEGTKARVRILERIQHRPATETDADDESENPCLLDIHNDHDPGGGSSSTELCSSRDHQNPVEIRPSPRRRPSRIPLLGAGNTKPTAPKPPSNNNHQHHRRNDSKDSLKSLTRQLNLSSSSSSTSIPKIKTQRDSSRESLNKSLTKSNNNNNNNSIKESSRESINRSLTRNSTTPNSATRDSLTRLGNHQQSRDSYESSMQVRRPPAPARRSQSQASRPPSVDNDSAKVRPVKQFFWTTWLK